MTTADAVSILECERKWVLRRPQSVRTLDAAAVSVASIEQWYLPKRDGARMRVRRTVTAHGVGYTLTRKRRLGATVAEELELPIDADEYRALLRMADPRRRPVRKTRWTLPRIERGVVDVAVDHLVAPAEAWVAEVEYAGPDLVDDGPGPPGWLGPRAEVTDMDGWRCAAIARRGLPPPP